ncbi:MAG: holo-ACP synthase [Atribacterota bacterium]|nr:holo-ACP synthase [Atribacterota bacterium]
MIAGCGIDIVDVKRIKKIIKKWDTIFLDKFFTRQEIFYCEQKNNNKFQSYAGYFAAKEALVKAFGTGFRYFKFKEIEIQKNNLGKPLIHLSANMEKTYLQNKIVKIHLSISHTAELAIAQVIIEKE